MKIAGAEICGRRTAVHLADTKDASATSGELTTDIRALIEAVIGRWEN